MLGIARAYSLTGNEMRFNDAMARVRAAHDQAMEQGVKDPGLAVEDATYYVLAGDQTRALSLLQQAADRGLVLSIRLEEAWPALHALAGDPEFEAIQTRIFEHMNAERAELGLEPLST
jgi:hypothetical protein